MPLNIATLNIEKNRHWEKVLPFVERTAPDVFCVQEIFECDMSKVEALGYHGVFSFISTQLYNPQDTTSGRPEGVAIFSKVPFLKTETHVYYHAPLPDKPQHQSHARSKRETTSQSIAVGWIPHEGHVYPVATTHFTWTPDGTSSSEQEEDLTNLLAYLARFPALVLTGDFNIPRGHNPLYARLVERFTDWIPEGIATSIDLAFHRAGKDPTQAPRLAKYMVDYLFTTPQYRVENIRQQFGLSDHSAFVGEVSQAG